MSCFTYTTHTLRSGSIHSYNTEFLGNPTNLAKKYHYSTNAYSTSNYNMAAGVAEYDRILEFIRKYQDIPFCPTVKDLAATYNALNSVLGTTGNNVMNKAQFMDYADQLDSRLPKQPQGKSAIRSKKAASQGIHTLRGRGVSGGRVLLVNIPELVAVRVEKDKVISSKAVIDERQRVLEESRIEQERIIEQQRRVDEEKRVKRELDREIALKAEKIRIAKQNIIDERNRILEEQRVQREFDREVIFMKASEADRIEREMFAAKQSQVDKDQMIQSVVYQPQITFNEQVNSGDFKEVIVTETIIPVEKERIEKIIKPETAMLGLIPLGIIGLLLYTRSVRK